MRQLMDDPDYRAAANRVRGEILALPTPAERIDDLVALLADAAGPCRTHYPAGLRTGHIQGQKPVEGWG